MHKFINFSIKTFLILFILSFISYKSYGEETDSILEQLEVLQNDFKTLEKAVYSQSQLSSDSSSTILYSNEGDVLTKHLLKLSELEEQFQTLTNNFEEINFKLDKLSNRITKIQSDNQMRFQDIEKSGLTQGGGALVSKKKKLPGSS